MRAGRQAGERRCWLRSARSAGMDRGEHMARYYNFEDHEHGEGEDRPSRPLLPQKSGTDTEMNHADDADDRNDPGCAECGAVPLYG